MADRMHKSHFLELSMTSSPQIQDGGPPPSTCGLEASSPGVPWLSSPPPLFAAAPPLPSSAGPASSPAQPWTTVSRLKTTFNCVISWPPRSQWCAAPWFARLILLILCVLWPLFWTVCTWSPSSWPASPWAAWAPPPPSVHCGPCSELHVTDLLPLGLLLLEPLELLLLPVYTVAPVLDCMYLISFLLACFSLSRLSSSSSQCTLWPLFCTACTWFTFSWPASLWAAWAPPAPCVHCDPWSVLYVSDLLPLGLLLLEPLELLLLQVYTVTPVLNCMYLISFLLACFSLSRLSSSSSLARCFRHSLMYSLNPRSHASLTRRIPNLNRRHTSCGSTGEHLKLLPPYPNPAS